MLNGFAKKLEITANFAIIIVATLLAVFLIRHYVLERDRVEPFAGNQPHAGTKLNLGDVDWSKDQQTLVMALSTTCHFCSESSAFYQKVARGRSNVRLLAVMPQTVNEAQKYLSDLGVTVDEIKQAQLNSIGVNGTPTLILVNNGGIVANTWVGKLTSAEESQVLSSLHIN